MISTISDTNNTENPVREPNWSSYFAPCLILLAPLIVFIDFHGHPFNNPEVLWIMLGMIMIGMFIGSFMKNMGNFGRALSLTLLLEFSLDLIGDFDDKGKIICAILAFLFSWFLREKAPKILTFTFSIFIITTLILPSDQLKPTLKEFDVVGKSNLPPVIHLILDGHIGVEGIPMKIKGGPELKEDIKSFYDKNGFRLYGNAYSHFSITLNSIPSLFNFNTEIEVDKSYAKEVSTDYEYQLLSNKYFQKMSSLGYKIKVYQSKYLDYCQGDSRIASCYTYPLFSTRFLDDLSISLDSKIWVLLNSYLIRSNFFNESKNGYWYLTNFLRQKFGLELPFPWKWNGRVTSPFAVSQTLSLVRDDLRTLEKGTLYFAHLLTPHSPFINDSNCVVYKNPISEWSVSVDPVSDDKQNSDKSRTKRYEMYFQQIKCLNKKLQGLFDLMRSQKIFEEAIIVVHGDHGSRIRIRRPIYANRNEITKEDLLDSYSTLFAVKIPDEQSEYNLQTLSLNQIFNSVFGKSFGLEKDIDTQEPYVNLRVRNPAEKKNRSFVKRPYSGLDF